MGQQPLTANKAARYVALIRQANLDGTAQRTLIRGQSQPGILALDLSVPPPLTITAAITSDAGLTLSWNALMGRAYEAQFSTNPMAANWTHLGSRLTATNTTMTAADSMVDDPQRFYRVFLLP